MFIICSTATFVILHGKGNHLHKIMLLHLLHLLHLQPLPLQLGAVHGVAQLYDGLPPCPELQHTQSLSLFNLNTCLMEEKIIGGQMIQIRGGKSALYGGQKRQMRGGKSVKLGGGKSAEGK